MYMYRIRGFVRFTPVGVDGVELASVYVQALDEDDDDDAYDDGDDSWRGVLTFPGNRLGLEGTAVLLKRVERYRNRIFLIDPGHAPLGVSKALIDFAARLPHLLYFEISVDLPLDQVDALAQHITSSGLQVMRLTSANNDGVAMSRALDGLSCPSLRHLGVPIQMLAAAGPAVIRYLVSPRSRRLEEFSVAHRSVTALHCHPFEDAASAVVDAASHGNVSLQRFELESHCLPRATELANKWQHRNRDLLDAAADTALMAVATLRVLLHAQPGAAATGASFLSLPMRAVATLRALLHAQPGAAGTGASFLSPPMSAVATLRALLHAQPGAAGTGASFLSLPPELKNLIFSYSYPALSQRQLGRVVAFAADRNTIGSKPANRNPEYRLLFDSRDSRWQRPPRHEEWLRSVGCHCWDQGVSGVDVDVDKLRPPKPRRYVEN